MARLCNRESDGPRTIPRSHEHPTKHKALVATCAWQLARFFRTISIIARKNTGQGTFSFHLFCNLQGRSSSSQFSEQFPTSGCIQMQICVVVVAAFIFSVCGGWRHPRQRLSTFQDFTISPINRHSPSALVSSSLTRDFCWCWITYLKMAYVGVEFKENGADQEGAIAIVHSAWLTPLKREVYWPPKQINKKFVRLLQSGADPEDGTWKLYSVIRIFFETDDYETAIKKIKKAEVTSNLDTDAPDESSFLTRKRKRPRKFSISEDEHSSSDHEEGRKKEKNKKQLPMPPLLNFNSSGKDFSECCSPTSALRRPNPDCGPSTSPSTSVLHRPNPQGTISHPASSCHSQPEFPVESDKGFQDQVLDYLITIRTQNRQILKLLSNSRNSDAIKIFELPEDLGLTLPVKNSVELRRLEEYLSDNNNLAAVGSYLSGFGGRDPTSKTNAVLRHLMTNELATKFSFLGTRNEKRAFVELKTRKVLVRAVQLTCKDITESDIDKFAKDWLKHAPKRHQNDLKRARADNGEEIN